MVTTARRGIDYSTFPCSDGQPVAETRANMDQMVGLIYAAEHYLATRVRFAVGGNQLVYYGRHNGWRHVSPDVFIALDVEPGKRQKWETWRDGRKWKKMGTASLPSSPCLARRFAARCWAPNCGWWGPGRG
jgi:hypothetical protein